MTCPLENLLKHPCFFPLTKTAVSAEPCRVLSRAFHERLAVATGHVVRSFAVAVIRIGAIVNSKQLAVADPLG